MELIDIQKQIIEMKSLILFCERRSKYWRDAGLEQLAKPFEDSLKVLANRLANVELLLLPKINSEQEPHLQQAAVTRSAPCSKDGCSNEAVCNGYCAAHCACPA
jgi:hypothetical protein